jgi:hypothetical protein
MKGIQIMKRNILISLGSLFFISNAFAAYEGQSCNDDEVKRCVNGDTDAWYGMTFTPSYKSIHDIDLIERNDTCKNEAATKIPIPRNTYFKQTNDHKSQTDEHLIVHVYNTDMDTDLATTSDKYFSKSFKFCLVEENKIDTDSYIRVGGLSTGILVIPYKFRQGDIYSDTTIGPYISYKREFGEVLATFGLAKISVSEVGTDKVETEDGLTFAIGYNLEITDVFDIALIVGIDHLSGSKGDDWEFQDKAWISFAIGFNFTN